MDKLKAALLDKQTDTRHIRAERRWRRGCKHVQQRSDVQTINSEEFFIRIPTKLKYCIRHHHEIRRCGYDSSDEQNGCFFLPLGAYGLHISFQIHAGIRRHDEYSTVECCQCARTYQQCVLIPSPPSR
jgi:hypothetical protein